MHLLQKTIDRKQVSCFLSMNLLNMHLYVHSETAVSLDALCPQMMASLNIHMNWQICGVVLQAEVASVCWAFPSFVCLLLQTQLLNPWVLAVAMATWSRRASGLVPPSSLNVWGVIRRSSARHCPVCSLYAFLSDSAGSFQELWLVWMFLSLNKKWSWLMCISMCFCSSWCCLENDWCFVCVCVCSHAGGLHGC